MCRTFLGHLLYDSQWSFSYKPLVNSNISEIHSGKFSQFVSSNSSALLCFSIKASHFLSISFTLCYINKSKYVLSQCCFTAKRKASSKQKKRFKTIRTFTINSFWDKFFVANNLSWVLFNFRFCKLELSIRESDGFQPIFSPQHTKKLN